MTVPEGILCSKTHEWVLEDGKYVQIGITDFLVSELGDIVFVELPEAGMKYSKNEVFATVESIKAASEIYMPVSGKVVEINESLINSPETINEDAFSSWFIKVEADDFQNDIQNLLEYDDYREDI